MTYSEVITIRHLLKKTWKYFFRPFGRLLPVQLQAIPLIISGDNVIIQSPTASGKTEAVIAPLIERLLQSKFNAPVLIYICPTRALIYDLYERLVQQVSDLKLTLAIRTGERRQFRPSNPQDILLTTPESLDSMLCRNQESLKNIKYIVLDELHLLHGTYRGDQLRMDLIRLRQVSNIKEIQFCALSATFQSPEIIAPEYFSPFKVVKIAGERELEYELQRYVHREKALSKLLRYFRKRGVKKAIFFCNSRRETEEVAQTLKRTSLWPKDRIFVHHGSLGKVERLATEDALRRERSAICVSTMSLEVGIDIGDIDMIVLVRPPPSVSSLLQRIGRGNRRGNITRGIGLFITDEEKDEFINLFERAKRGDLEEYEGGPCLSVAIQQIFSILYQFKYRGASDEQIKHLLKKLPMKESNITLLIQHLINKEYVESYNHKLYPSIKLTNLGERGFIHSNIPGSLTFKVIDTITGKSVGEISTFDQINKAFVLGGRRWIVATIDGAKINVKQSRSAPGVPPIFSIARTHGRYFNLLPPKLKLLCSNKIQK